VKKVLHVYAVCSMCLLAPSCGSCHVQCGHSRLVFIHRVSHV